MPDSEPDLYSFLQSKDFADDEDEAEEVQTVDSFADSDEIVSEEFGYSFDDEELGEELRTCAEDTLDHAPFGIVKVDDDGVVQFYNQYEAKLADVNPEDALGKNFFTQLAPCSGNRLFHGRFKDGVRKGDLDERFTYTFTYKMSPTLVQVRMYRDEEGQNWIMIRKQ